MFKINNKKTPERHLWRRSGVFIVNFEHIIIYDNFDILLQKNCLKNKMFI